MLLKPWGMGTPIFHRILWMLLCAVGLALTPLGWIPAQTSDTNPTDESSEDLPAATIHPWLRLSINIAAKELRVLENNQVVARYQVAIGEPRYPSPEFSDDISQIIWNPSWIPPPSPWAAGASVAPPGPHNPLGPVKMPITAGILIHGTNKPKSVGHASSHGCFRMHSEEAANLAWYIQERASLKNDPSLWEHYRHNRYRTQWVQLSLPVPVDVVYQTAEVEGERLTLYPDVYRRVHNWNDEIRGVLALHGLNVQRIHDKTIAQLVQLLRNGPTSIPLRDLLDNRVATTQ